MRTPKAEEGPIDREAVTITAKQLGQPRYKREIVAEPLERPSTAKRLRRMCQQPRVPCCDSSACDRASDRKNSEQGSRQRAAPGQSGQKRKDRGSEEPHA